MQNIVKQYIIYFAAIALMIAAVVYMLYALYFTRHRIVFYDSRHFHFRSEQYPIPNPLADAKNRTLSLITGPEQGTGQPDPEDKTSALVDNIIRLFVGGRIDQIESAFNGFSYFDSTSPPVFHFPEPELRSVKSYYSHVRTRDVVIALDRTLLLTAYLYERMGYAKPASKYYSAYYSALKRFLPPGMDDGDFSASARASLARLKLHSVLPVLETFGDGYARRSYTNARIEDILRRSLDSDEIKFYRRKGLVQNGETPGRHAVIQPSPDARNDSSLGIEQTMINAEYCLYLLNYAEYDFDKCDLAALEDILGRRSFMLSSIYYKLLLKSAQGGLVVGEKAAGPSSAPTHATADTVIPTFDPTDTSVDNSESSAPRKLLWQDFERLRDSVRSHAGVEAAHFADDLLAFEYDHLDPSSNDARLVLCKLSALDPKAADFALVAAAKAKEIDVDCSK